MIRLIILRIYYARLSKNVDDNYDTYQLLLKQQSFWIVKLKSKFLPFLKKLSINVNH